MMELESVRNEVASKLPEKFEPLLLTFYGRQSKLAGTWIVIGDDYGTKFHLDINDGSIRAVDDNGCHPTRFVNSSLGQLSACISAYDRAQLARLPNLGADELLHSAEMFRATVEQIDEMAIEDLDNWWSTIIEQMKDGFL